uniref:Similarity n=1 Tax=Ascaris lumbricoides TaxID=6252 RepID=A0A0M3HL82_ASCLU
MISSWHYEESHYGSAIMKRKTAETVTYNGAVVQVSHIDDPIFFNKRVFILTKLSPYEYSETSIQPSPVENLDEPIYHTPDEERYKYFNSPPEESETELWQFFHKV